MDCTGVGDVADADTDTDTETETDVEGTVGTLEGVEIVLEGDVTVEVGTDVTGPLDVGGSVTGDDGPLPVKNGF